MKRITTTVTSLAIVCTMLFTTGCEKEDLDKVINITVASKETPGTTLFSEIPTDHMRVLVGGSSKWEAFPMGKIEGFEYESGYLYVLKVNKYKIKNPPADGSSIGYKLLEVLSKTKEE